jgi:hypothetical protein
MNKLNFIIDKIPGIKLLGSVQSDSTFSLLINGPEDIRNIDLQNLHKKGIYLDPFCCFSIYLNFQNNNSANQRFIEELNRNTDLLLQLFFHYRFEKSNNKPVLFLSLNAKNNSQVDLFLKKIDSIAISQGYDGIESVYLNEQADAENTLDVLYNIKDVDNFPEAYYQLLVDKLYVARYLGIINLPEEQFSNIMDLQLKTENKLMKNVPALFHFMKKYFQFSKQMPLLEEELKHLRSDLVNQKIYLQFFKDQDEALKINEFYHYEYEILPMWYKKVGHLLKVIMRKRSFRSLFNNNVKKYKK